MNAMTKEQEKVGNGYGRNSPLFPAVSPRWYMEFQAFHQTYSSAAAACDSPHGEASINARVTGAIGHSQESKAGPASLHLHHALQGCSRS
jgi:hypothetical protein